MPALPLRASGSTCGGLLSLPLALVFAPACLFAEKDAEREFRILATDRDLDGLVPSGPKSISSWRWTPEQKAGAHRYSQMEISRDSAGRLLWTLRVAPDIPFVLPYLEVLSLGNKYFPPEADAIRMKIRAVSGSLLLSFGGPTAYFGNSDVLLRPLRVDAEKDGDAWRTVEFSLHHGQLRNFRRAGYSENSPAIHYARWAQEPTYAYLLRGSAGEAHIRDIEILAKGLARPFPQIETARVEKTALLADFASPTDRAKAFTVLMGETDEEFRTPPLLHPPARLGEASDPREGSFLEAAGRFREEVSAVGVELPALPGGDALGLRLRVESSLPVSMLPDTETHPVDILLFTAPDPRTFEWRPFNRPPEQTGDSHPRFDRNLTFRKLKSIPECSLAIYHARRFVPPRQWENVFVPFEDFACLYGQGACLDSFKNQLPPDSARVIAAALVSPWPRRGQPQTTLGLRTISLIRRTEGYPLEHSYYRPSPAPLLRPHKGRFAFSLLPGETSIPADLLQIFE